MIKICTYLGCVNLFDFIHENAFLRNIIPILNNINYQ